MHMTFHKMLSLARHPVCLYGIPMGILVFILKWLQWKFLVADHSIELYTGLIAVFFTALGIWIATRLATPKVQTVIVEKEILVEQPTEFVLNEAELDKLNLSRREYEVLQILSTGASNAEIAESLFLSLSTVKTHVSNLFVKMEVKNRGQAIEKAKRLKITA
jgi:NarL family two-component system response regulator LiaR